MISYENIQIIIPAAGKGSRFIDVGITIPKPIIDVLGKPMFKWAISAIPFFDKIPPQNITVIVRQEHVDEFDIISEMKKSLPEGVNFCIDPKPVGAATSVLVAKDIINNNKATIIMDSDLFFKSKEFEDMVLLKEDIDGGIPVFKAEGDKWSFSKFGEDNIITKTAEKVRISEYGNIGFYYFRKGSEFVEFAEKLVEMQKQHKNEYYISLVIDLMIKSGKKFYAAKVESWTNLGIPDDLDNFVESQK